MTVKSKIRMIESALMEQQSVNDMLNQRIEDLKKVVMEVAGLAAALKDTQTSVMVPSLFEAIPGLKEIVTRVSREVVEKQRLAREAAEAEAVAKADAAKEKLLQEVTENIPVPENNSEIQ